MNNNHQNVILLAKQKIYIYIYIYTYTRIPVATLPDSSPPLTLRGGSAYGLYEWCRCSSHKKKIIWSDQIENFKTCMIYIEILIYKILWPWVFYFGRDRQNADWRLVQCGWSTINLIIPIFSSNALLI